MPGADAQPPARPASDGNGATQPAPAIGQGAQAGELPPTGNESAGPVEQLVVPLEPVPFSGDTKPVAAKALGVPDDQLVLRQRLDYGYTVVDVYAPAGDKSIPSCNIDSKTGMLLGLALAYPPRADPHRQVLPHAEALTAARTFLADHNLRLSPAAQMMPVSEPSFGVYTFRWFGQAHGVRLEDDAHVKIDAYTGQVCDYYCFCPRLDVPLEPKFSEAQVTETARRFAAEKRFPLDEVKRCSAQLQVMRLPTNPPAKQLPKPRIPGRTPAWEPGHPPDKTVIGVTTQHLVWAVDVPLDTGPGSRLKYFRNAKLTVFVDALTGEAADSMYDQGLSTLP